MHGSSSPSITLAIVLCHLSVVGEVLSIHIVEVEDRLPLTVADYVLKLLVSHLGVLVLRSKMFNPIDHLLLLHHVHVLCLSFPVFGASFRPVVFGLHLGQSKFKILTTFHCGTLYFG